jgi:3-dehydroquinate synthase
MNTAPHSNLYLTGFSYTGKTTVGRLVAQRLGLHYLDTDAEIERLAGKSVPAIFANEGEAYFRELEAKLLAQLAQRRDLVVATGGGIVQDPANRALMAQSGAVVCLEARPETILHRMREDQAANATDRPLLTDPEPLERIHFLKARRQRFYALADWTVQTDSLTAEEVAHEVTQGAEVGWRRWRSGALIEPSDTTPEDPDLAYVVRTETTSYPIVVGAGVLESIGARLKALGLSGQAHVISDESVAGLLGQTVLESLHEAGFRARLLAVPPGETSKTLAHAEVLYGWLAQGRAERRDLVIAVGGGVVGDLAGFVAATYVRGMPFVQVPTTLLAMVDASIGGKVAIDLPVGKNLVGAFHQPALVLSDVRTLATLPERERVAGWAEVIKTGLILDADLVEYLERHVDGLLSGDEAAVAHAVGRCAALKGRVVSLDERETTGLRALLNYGHTLGHALETVTSYTGLLHGEAVAIGMAFAAELAVHAKVLRPEDRERQVRLIHRFGLPSKSPERIDVASVRSALSLDKKVAGGRTRWVLLDSVGHGRLHGDLAPEMVDGALEEFLARTG